MGHDHTGLSLTPDRRRLMVWGDERRGLEAPAVAQPVGRQGFLPAAAGRRDAGAGRLGPRRHDFVQTPGTPQILEVGGGEFGGDVVGHGWACGHAAPFKRPFLTSTELFSEIFQRLANPAPPPEKMCIRIRVLPKAGMEWTFGPDDRSQIHVPALIPWLALLFCLLSPSLVSLTTRQHLGGGVGGG